MNSNSTLNLLHYYFCIENWNGPLPQHLKDQSESSLLSTHNLDQGVTNDVRAREYRGRVSTLIPSCTIS